MSLLGPLVPGGVALPVDCPPGAPRRCAGRLREWSRLEWRVGDGGDPAALVTTFLEDAGLRVGDLSPTRVNGSSRQHGPDDGLCGAALLVSAAAGAVLAGGAPGPASPATAVPDVVAVVYGHGPPARHGQVPAVCCGQGAAARPWPPAAAGRWGRGLVTGLRVADGDGGAGWPQGGGGARGWPQGGGGAGGWRVGAWVPSWDPAEHAAAVAKVREAISRGDVYQVNLVGHASAPWAGDPSRALRRVAALSGARYGGVVSGAGWLVACASPETLVQVVAGRVRTGPIKGTRPATVEGRAQLLASAKERAEHVMIVDLVRNDLGRVATTGSVRVDELYAVRRWCDLWQAESVVSARLAAGVGLAGLLRAVCPAGSVTGAPKLAAVDTIARLEPVGRGPSMGALGWVAADRVDLGLTIRTVALDEQRAHVWAGGGVTWGSDPAAEVAEAAAKAAPLLAALGGA
ncbi:MAG TPA: chorismate-binding protein [Micromonosporaceae bacterium]|nr:chorismate-binding protein [Micromonosporaceae bacterium]